MTGQITSVVLNIKGVEGGQLMAVMAEDENGKSSVTLGRNIVTRNSFESVLKLAEVLEVTDLLKSYFTPPVPSENSNQAA